MTTYNFLAPHFPYYIIWDYATNWSPNGVPGPGDTANLNGFTVDGFIQLKNEIINGGGGEILLGTINTDNFWSGTLETIGDPGAISPIISVINDATIVDHTSITVDAFSILKLNNVTVSGGGEGPVSEQGHPGSGMISGLGPLLLSGTDVIGGTYLYNISILVDDNSTVTCTKNDIGSATFYIGSNSTLNLDLSPTGTGNNLSGAVEFSGNNSTLRITDPSELRTGNVNLGITVFGDFGFQGDSIVLPDVNYFTRLSYTSGSVGNVLDTLTLSDKWGADTTLSLFGQYSAAGFHETVTKSGGTVITYTPPSTTDTTSLVHSH